MSYLTETIWICTFLLDLTEKLSFEKADYWVNQILTNEEVSKFVINDYSTLYLDHFDSTMEELAKMVVENFVSLPLLTSIIINENYCTICVNIESLYIYLRTAKFIFVEQNLISLKTILMNELHRRKSWKTMLTVSMWACDWGGGVLNIIIRCSRNGRLLIIY